MTAQAKGYLSMMMFVMSYFVICQMYNSTMVVGIFRGGGDTRFGLILDVSTMWCCSIVFGALAAFVWKLPVTIVYMILLGDEIIIVHNDDRNFCSRSHIVMTCLIFYRVSYCI